MVVSLRKGYVTVVFVHFILLLLELKLTVFVLQERFL